MPTTIQHFLYLMIIQHILFSLPTFILWSTFWANPPTERNAVREHCVSYYYVLYKVIFFTPVIVLPYWGIVSASQVNECTIDFVIVLCSNKEKHKLMLFLHCNRGCSVLFVNSVNRRYLCHCWVFRGSTLFSWEETSIQECILTVNKMYVQHLNWPLSSAVPCSS